MVTDLLNVVNADPRMVVYPVDKAVVDRSIDLSAITEMHDRLIVATAFVLRDRGEKIALLTCDRACHCIEVINSGLGIKTNMSNQR